ncbi:MAG: glutamine amidotransferase [Fibromonadaceae bacterium]|nr:glutamine amidotransferase [Fibromonadaceae bacterium]
MNVFLYVLDSLADWEIGFLTAEINSGRYLKKKIEKPKIVKAGKNLNPITTMGGIEIIPDIDVKEIKMQKNDLLILPGGNAWLNENNDEIINFLKENIDKDITIAAICGATIALAYNSLLNERKHTSNDLGFLKMTCPNYKGEKYYCNNYVAIDNNLITATGLAPLEFAYEIFKKTDIMEKTAAEAWYNLYKTKESKYFFELMEAVK